MNLISLFRRNNSAPVARERLQVLLAHERVIVDHIDAHRLRILDFRGHKKEG